MVLVQQENPIGDGLDDVEVMGGGDDRLAAAALADQEVDQPGLAARVQAGGRLVKQPDGRVQAQDGGDGDPLFLAAGKAMRRPLAERLDAQRSTGPPRRVR